MNGFEEYTGSFTAEGIDILQINVGSKCNKACTHCHLEASPSRMDLMPWETMRQVIYVARENRFKLIDITGGAPELNPNLKRFISETSELAEGIQVRTNLSALFDSGMDDLAKHFAKYKVGLVASLPCYLEQNVDAMRGSGTHASSMIALRKLNEIGYGIEQELPIDLVYNPAGAFLPPSQWDLEKDYRRELGDNYGVRFRNLLTISNMPIGRFMNILESNHEYGQYMNLLRENYNPSTISGLMCKRQVSVRWDGMLFDCDFNLALDMPLNHGAQTNIENFDMKKISRRRIMTGEHCFGCTAGSGSSCAGAIA